MKLEFRTMVLLLMSAGLYGQGQYGAVIPGRQGQHRQHRDRPNDRSVELGYIGNLGRKLTFPNTNLNHIPPELLPRTEIPPRLRHPYPRFRSRSSRPIGDCRPITLSPRSRNGGLPTASAGSPPTRGPSGSTT